MMVDGFVSNNTQVDPHFSYFLRTFLHVIPKRFMELPQNKPKPKVYTVSWL